MCKVVGLGHPYPTFPCEREKELVEKIAGFIVDKGLSDFVESLLLA